PPDIRSGSETDGKMLPARFSWELIFEKIAQVLAVPQSWRRSTRHRLALLDQQIEPIQIDGLDQMMMESDVVTAAHIFFHAKSRQGGAENRMFSINGLHEIDAATVRQTGVAHQNVEPFVCGKLERRLDAARRLHVITAP